MSVSYPKRYTAHFVPYKWVKAWIAVTIRMPVVYRQREVSVHPEVGMRRVIGIPWRNHADILAMACQPPGIVLYSDCHPVKYRGETVIEEAVNALVVHRRGQGWCSLDFSWQR